jgi:ABC-type dipeptide/oligopeptide/nickel transport system ATPase component
MEGQVMAVPSPVLELENLTLSSAEDTDLVSDVSFSLFAGEALGLVGESGSGKTLTLRGIIGLLPSAIHQRRGHIRRDGRCAMIFQDPQDALDPLVPVGKQLAEVVYYRQGKNKKEALVKARELLELVRIPDPGRRMAHYPHQFSGGQCQRIVIALALAAKPRVLLCDEPTTALDVTVQKQILEVIDHLRTALNLAVLFVSHDLALVSSQCSRICVMSGGRIVESGATSDVLGNPRHPYTRSLIDAILPLPSG